MGSEPEGVKLLREKCLKRGVHGIKGLGRTFRIYDDNRDKKLNYEELKEGLRDYGLDLPEKEIHEVFSHFDRDSDGNIIFDEFLRAIRPPMSKARVDIIEKAFKKFDVTGDGVITIEDLIKHYKVDHHPKYQSGEMTRKQILEEFLKTFEPDDMKKPVKKGGDNGPVEVTWEEFLNYYAGVSASIDKDVYFDYMMRQTWKL